MCSVIKPSVCAVKNGQGCKLPDMTHAERWATQGLTICTLSLCHQGLRHTHTQTAHKLCSWCTLHLLTLSFFSHSVCLPVLLQLNLSPKVYEIYGLHILSTFMCSLYCPSAFAFFLSRLHEVLMDLQQQQLQQLSDWLTQTEERIRRIETQPAAKGMEAYKEQIEQHKVRTVYR